MKKQLTFCALAAAAALTFAQTGADNNNGAQPRTSTAGLGCTATGNAMSSGALGGGPGTGKCDTAATKSAATTTTTAPATAATTSTDTSSTTASTSTTDTTASAATSTKDKTAGSSKSHATRVARADRG